MLALLALAAVLDASPAPSCAGGDPAVTNLRVKLIKKRNAPDHYVVTGTISNLGAQAQQLGIVQRVELVRDGAVLARQPLPALGTGVNYQVAFAFDRPAAARKSPLPLTMRYVLQRGDAARDDCTAANDTLTKTF